MAIDPTIALGIRPMESPLDSYGKALGVQGMQHRNTLANLGIQEQTTQLQNTKNYNDAVAASIDPATGMPDYQKVSQILAQKGSGSMIPGIMKQNVEMQAAQAKAQQEHFAVMKQKADMMGQRIGALASDPTSSKQSIVMEGQKALQDGLLDPQHYQSMIQQVQQLPDDAGAVHGFLMQQLQQNRSVSDQLDRLTPKITTQMVGGQIVPVTTTQATGQVTAGAPVTSAPTTDLAKINADEKAGLLSASEAAAARKKATYIAPNMAVMMMGGMGGGGAALQSQIEAYKESLLKGQVPFPTGRDLADPVRSAAYKAAIQEDPTFNAATYLQRKKTSESFSSGKQGDTINAINTAMGHMGELSDLSEKLGNSDVQFANAVKNKFKQETGDPEITAFNTARKAVADEVTKIYRQSGGSEADIQEAMKNLSPNQSPAQLRANIFELYKLLGSKVNSLSEQYHKGMGKVGGDFQVFTPEAKAQESKILARYQGTSAPVQQSRATSGVSVGMDAKKSDGTVLPDGDYHGFSVKNGKVSSVE